MTTVGGAWSEIVDTAPRRFWLAGTVGMAEIIYRTDDHRANVGWRRGPLPKLSSKSPSFDGRHFASAGFSSRLRRMSVSATPSSPTRRSVLAATVAAGATGLFPTNLRAAAEDIAVRPFRINVPEDALVDLRRRIAATRWPDQETVADESQGVQLATIQELARYWQKDYDWRKIEARLNALPQFITEIDGLDVYFIHVRSKHENALPLIVTHGWPGSIIEQLKIIEPLTNPTAHGASAADAFHLVIPSLPGYGFSGKPNTTGWGPESTARAWVQLMKHLGYTKFVAQGGDLGAGVCTAMAK